MRRRTAYAGGVTVLCCDNMAEQWSHAARPSSCQFAEQLDPDLAIPGSRIVIRFPSSMVDLYRSGWRLPQCRSLLALPGLRDEAAVSAEAFIQWVIEDDFRSRGRPQPGKSSDVELVRDVRPTRGAEPRLLDGAHTAIANIEPSLGKPFVADVMADPALARFIERLMLDDIAPLTPAPPGFDVEGYVRALLGRFANRGLQHRTLQIAMDGSQHSRALVAGAARGTSAWFAGPRTRDGPRRLASLPVWP